MLWAFPCPIEGLFHYLKFLNILCLIAHSPSNTQLYLMALQEIARDQDFEFHLLRRSINPFHTGIYFLNFILLHLISITRLYFIHIVYIALLSSWLNLFPINLALSLRFDGKTLDLLILNIHLDGSLHWIQYAIYAPLHKPASLNCSSPVSPRPPSIIGLHIFFHCTVVRDFFCPSHSM